VLRIVSIIRTRIACETGALMRRRHSCLHARAFAETKRTVRVSPRECRCTPRENSLASTAKHVLLLAASYHRHVIRLFAVFRFLAAALYGRCLSLHRSNLSFSYAAHVIAMCDHARPGNPQGSKTGRRGAPHCRRFRCYP
jgi:hypothetical protein